VRTAGTSSISASNMVLSLTLAARHRDRQRQATAVADQVELGAGLATIDGICANMILPL
jgi:hypothetical protein